MIFRLKNLVYSVTARPAVYQLGHKNEYGVEQISGPRCKAAETSTALLTKWQTEPHRRFSGDVTQHWLVVTNFLWQHFGPIKGQQSWPLNIGETGCPETSVTTNQRCVTYHKDEDLIYTAAEAWNHAT
jgi:hypothetical protein